MRDIRNFIAGQWCDSVSGKRGQVTNPANRNEVLANTPASEPADAERAIAAAAAAFPAWSRIPAPQRAALLHGVMQKFAAREEEFVQCITAENGKALRESRGEFQAALKEAEFQIGQGRRFGDRLLASEVPGATCYLARQPLGVVTLITPWNFPLNVACRKMLPALIAGNCCVVKPSDLTPISAALLFECVEAAGLPAGVANLLIGRGSVVGDTLVTHPSVQAVSFTGSTEVGIGISRKLESRATKVQLEMGGKNPLVVLADANLEAAVDAAIAGAFSCAGQWCTSTSRAIVEAPIHDAFVARLSEKVRAIKVGHGTDEKIWMGPVCGQKQYETILKFIELGKKEGARLCAGGAALTDGIYRDGCFIAPTVFADVRPEMTIAQEEIFGPVLVVIKAAGFDEALQIANGIKYGLASSIYTNDLAKAQRFVAESEVGLCHVNMITAWKEPQLEFGGIKESGRGAPEAGESGIEFFTHHKAVYVRGAS
jgi:alpha-ketoglutaric semialdehyde dehydrogenase